MRIASLIVGLVLSVVAGIQSLTVYAASSISDSLSEKSDPSSTTSAGAFGALAAFVMFIAAAFALAKPKAARWIFAAAAALWKARRIAAPGPPQNQDVRLSPHPAQASPNGS